MKSALSQARRVTTSGVATRFTQRPLALTGLALVAVESVAALMGATTVGAALAVLIVAPGLALVPLLPRRARDQPVAAVAAAGALGFATAATALITISRLGVPLTGESVRLTVAVLVLAGLALPGEEPRERPRALELVGLTGCAAIALVLAERTTGTTPPPGNDWAKYLLYADEIRAHGKLLIDNPFWMLGVPFREDPAVPALFGSALRMSGGSAGALSHGIWLFAVLGVLSTFALVRAFAGSLPALLAAGIVAAVPINQSILGWHGLANVAALALLPVVLLFAAALLDGERGRSAAAGFALALIGLAAAHRLTFVVGAGAIALALAAGLLTRRRPAVVRGAAATAAGLVVLGGGVAADLLARQRTFGGTLPYEAYLDTKIQWDLVLKDLSLPFAIAGALAAAILLARARRRPEAWPALGAVAVVLALGYAWVAHVPLYYLRAVYFLPIPLAVLIGLAAARVPPRRAARVAATVGGAGIVLFAGIAAWRQAPDTRRFYAFANPTSLRGIEAVSATLRPREVVVTDRCWSFLATWLLRTRTLPAISPQDIQPRAELAIARRAQAVVDGTREGRRTVRRLGIRYVLVDPTCVGGDGRRLPPPAVGRTVFVSPRLVVFRL